MVTKPAKKSAKNIFSPAKANVITENLLANPVMVIPPITRPAAAQAAVTPIILKVETERGERVMGIVVDAVSDVHSISDSDTRNSPDLIEDLNTEFIRSLVSVDDSMIILLDVQRLLTIDRQIIDLAADAVVETE